MSVDGCGPDCVRRPKMASCCRRRHESQMLSGCWPRGQRQRAGLPHTREPTELVHERPEHIANSGSLQHLASSPKHCLKMNSRHSMRNTVTVRMSLPAGVAWDEKNEGIMGKCPETTIQRAGVETSARTWRAAGAMLALRPHRPRAPVESEQRHDPLKSLSVLLHRRIAISERRCLNHKKV
jgi:hypothetical protein